MTMNTGLLIDSFVSLLNPDFRTPADWRGEWGVAALPLVNKNASPILRRYLREFVDEWIDSGFAEDGSEQPSLRNLTPKALACKAMAKFEPQMIIQSQGGIVFQAKANWPGGPRAGRAAKPGIG